MQAACNRYFIFERSFLRNVLAIAIPIALQNMISFGVALMDSVMLGKFGDVAIAAVSVGNQPFSILMSVGFGLSSGGSVLIAQYWGRKDMASIRTVMRMSMQIVTVSALAIMVACLLFPVQICSLFNSDPDVVRTAVSYLTLVAFSYLPYSIANNYMMSLRAVEKVKVSTAIYGVSFFVNVFFNYVFIFGKLGAPRMEVRGAAVGTVLARCSELLMVLLYMYGKENLVKFRLHHCRTLDVSLARQYVHHSLPVLGNELLWGLGFSLTTLIIGRISSVFLAANSIASVLNQFAFVSIIGVANAAAVLTGRTIGEGDHPRAQRVANTLMLLSLGMGLFNCMLVLAVRPWFLMLYNVTPETADAAWTILSVLAALQLVIGIDITCIVGILRGGGDTRTAFLYDCGALWLVSIPIGVLGGLVLGWPVPLVYACLKLDSPIKAVLSFFRIRSGLWIRSVTAQPCKAAVQPESDCLVKEMDNITNSTSHVSGKSYKIISE
jgi:putative MATE family efflux protein